MTHHLNGIDRPPHPRPQTEARTMPPVRGGAFRPHDPATEARARDRSAHRALTGLWEDLE
jgi:hypothetical protein